MEGRPHGSLTSSDGYGRANSASYPAYTDSRDDGRAYRALLTQRRPRQGLQGLAHTAETTAGLTGPCSHSRDHGRAYRALLTQQRRRQGLQGLAHTAETTAGLTGPCSHRAGRRQGQQRLEHSKHGQLRWRGGLLGLSHLATATAGPTAPHTQHTRTAETTAGPTGPCSHSRDDGRAYRALLTQSRTSAGSTAP